MNNNLRISSATGVDLNLNIAGAGARSYAFVIDWHIRLLLAFAWFVVAHFFLRGFTELPDSESADFHQYMFVAIVPAVALFLLYHPVLEIAMHGRTPGKRIAGVRIVSLDGQEPGLLAHVIRNVLRLLDSLPAGYVIGLVCTQLTEDSVRIGDLAAGTLLVYESDARGGSLKAQQFNPLTVRTYGVTGAEVMQDFLDRWDSTDPVRRVELARKLLARVTPAQPVPTDEAEMRAMIERVLLTAGRS